MKIKMGKKVIFTTQALGARGFLNFLSDETYLKKLFKEKMGKPLDLSNPVTFNEKLQWLKLHDRNDIYTEYVDKYEVRRHIKNILGDEYLIPLLGVWNNPDEIDFDGLPNQFVLKCTHGSHCIIICKDKSLLDINDAKKKLKKWMKRNWFWFGREWPYKNVKPRIIAEKYMVDESGYELKDYKMFCFDGKIKLIIVCFNRSKEFTINSYDENWNFLDVKYSGNPNNKKAVIEKPVNLHEMIKLGNILSKGHSFLRVDFYSIKNKLYFGELTFFPISGYIKFEPKEWDYKLGSMINLDEVNNV